MSTPTSVYRYLDADGVLIYVGITNRGMLRQNEHNASAQWWRFVCSQEVEHYDDRQTAMRRERYLIERHRPPFNTQHNPDCEQRRASYLQRVDRDGKSCDQCAVEWQQGLDLGRTLAVEEARQEIRDMSIPFEAIQLVVDSPEWRLATGPRTRSIDQAEDAIRAMDAEIAKRGLTAIVDEAAQRRLRALEASA